MVHEQSYRYLTGEEMKGFGDDSAPIDVTRDERCDVNTGKTPYTTTCIIIKDRNYMHYRIHTE